LIDEWRLARHEVAYIDRQQGLYCTACASNLRSMALANAILKCFGHPGPFVEFVQSETAALTRVLEVNEAGALTKFFRPIPGHVLIRYPEADMMGLPFKDETFDLVVHSDTLEHVPQPIRGLSECRRVLKPGSFCAFTVPLIVDRLTLSREGMQPSYHGSPTNPGDYLVHTEYGADAWKHVVLAGFRECRIVPLEYPAALAMVGVK
jgi:SAM-dependent methyltransferase